MSLRFTKKDRQNIIDDYLNQTGRNSYVPSEFVDWLRDNQIIKYIIFSLVRLMKKWQTNIEKIWLDSLLQVLELKLIYLKKH